MTESLMNELEKSVFWPVFRNPATFLTVEFCFILTVFASFLKSYRLLNIKN